jgi:hypothetical protein
MILNEQVPRLFEIYGLGSAAAFSVFVALYFHAYRQRSRLGLTPEEGLETKLSMMSNGGLVAVAVASIVIAALGGARAAAPAGLVYFMIAPLEWMVRSYGDRERRRLSTASTSPA